MSERFTCALFDMSQRITVIGGGLAGSEAAWQVARLGLHVRLYEMRPLNTTPAHKTDLLAELVCSNSLKSEQPGTAPYLLKEELRCLGSLLMRVADEVRVPAGHALAVDRNEFAARASAEIYGHPRIEVIIQEVKSLPTEGIRIVASGPLTSAALSQSIAGLTGADHLYFYDAISPIVDAATLDRTRLFFASRYEKGGNDYLNAPMSREEYLSFYDALIHAESAPLREFEK